MKNVVTRLRALDSRECGHYICELAEEAAAEIEATTKALMLRNEEVVPLLAELERAREALRAISLTGPLKKPDNPSSEMGIRYVIAQMAADALTSSKEQTDD